MSLAAFTGAAAGAVIGGYLLLVLIWFAFNRRDVTGRRRALGCMFGLVVFFGAFVLALGAWLIGDVF